MEKMTELLYDAEGDILYLSVGKPRRAISQEMGDDVLLRVDPDSGEIVGLTILNLASRFGTANEPHTLPIEMALHKSE
jgi:uncharacterized protein YuzE